MLKYFMTGALSAVVTVGLLNAQEIAHDSATTVEQKAAVEPDHEKSSAPAPLLNTADTLSQKPLQVTIYDNNLAFVRDTRSIHFKKGLQHIDFRGISEGLIPKTFFMRVLPKELNIQMREQRLMLESPTYRSLLKASMGKNIKFEGSANIKEGVLVGIEAPNTLLIESNGYLKKVKNPHVLFDNKQHMFQGSPSINAFFDAPEAVAAQVELSYLTPHMNWSTHYTAEVNEADDSVDFLGLTTLQNNTQVQLRQAHLLLAATATPLLGMKSAKPAKIEGLAKDALTSVVPGQKTMTIKENPEQETVAESQPQVADFKPKDLRGNSYKLNQLVDIAPGESKNIVYAQANKISGERQFWLVINLPYDRDGDGVITTLPITSMISIANQSDSNLGLPLPAGSLLVYHRTGTDFAKVSDQTRISHTPVGGKIPLRLGDAEGIESTVQQTDYKMLAPKVLETGYRVILKNTRNKPVSIRVLKELKAASTHNVVVTRENHAHRLENGLLWVLEVPAKDQVELRYRLRVTAPDEVEG